jgi:hypothetical protein
VLRIPYTFDVLPFDASDAEDMYNYIMTDLNTSWFSQDAYINHVIVDVTAPAEDGVATFDVILEDEDVAGSLGLDSMSAVEMKFAMIGIMTSLQQTLVATLGAAATNLPPPTNETTGGTVTLSFTGAISTTNAVTFSADTDTVALETDAPTANPNSPWGTPYTARYTRIQAQSARSVPNLGTIMNEIRRLYLYMRQHSVDISSARQWYKADTFDVAHRLRKRIHPSIDFGLEDIVVYPGNREDVMLNWERADRIDWSMDVVGYPNPISLMLGFLVYTGCIYPFGVSSSEKTPSGYLLLRDPTDDINATSKFLSLIDGHNEHCHNVADGFAFFFFKTYETMLQTKIRSQAERIMGLDNELQKAKREIEDLKTVPVVTTEMYNPYTWS